MALHDPSRAEQAPEDSRLPRLPLSKEPFASSSGAAPTQSPISSPSTPSEASAADQQVVIDRCATLKVGGMTCSNCSSAVERALGKLQDVVRCEVDLISEKAVVWYRSSSKTKPSDFCEEVEDIGFEASLIEDAAVETGPVDGGQTNICLVAEGRPEAAAEFLAKQTGVTDVVIQGKFLKATYNPHAAGARDLIAALKSNGHEVVLDPSGAAARAASESSRSDGLPQGLLPAVLLTSCIVIICWVLPCFPHCMTMLMKEVVPGLPFMTFLMCLLATPVQLVCARRIHIGAYHSLKSGVWDMNVLISLGTFLTFSYSLTVVIFMMVMRTDKHGLVCKAPPSSYFEAPCMVISFILVGKAIEGWAKMQTSTSLRALMAMKPSEAHLLPGGSGTTEARKIHMDLVQVGDIVQVFPGQAAPADGCMALAVSSAKEKNTVVATFDESLLTGEARPVPKRQGDFIIGGSKCVSGLVEMRVQRIGSTTMLSQITSMVQRAQLSRAPVQQVADAVAHRFVPLVISLAVLTWAVWYWVVYRAKLVPIAAILKGRASDWPELDKFFFVLEHGLTVLLVACPCALGLATPTAVMTATGVASRLGILVPSGAGPLEIGSKVERVVLDKTGTLTIGQPKVMHSAALCPWASGGGLAPEWRKLVEAYRQKIDAPTDAPSPAPRHAPPVAWLARAGSSIMVAGSTEAAASRAKQRSEAECALWWAIGSAEMPSEHPLARELAEVAARVVREGALTKPCAFQNITGVGVKCTLAGVEVKVASARHILGSAEDGCGPTADWVRAMKAEGATVVSVSIDDVPLASVAMRDKLAPHSRSCVVEMQMNGLEVWMCTGDHRAAALAVARECGIDESRIIADALPADKVAVVQRLQEGEDGRKHIVAMVGDGVNDAPALAAADLGVAIGAGHDVTVDAADIVLVRTDLRDLVTFFELSRVTLWTIWRNFAWALGFNMCALPVAAGAFWRKGVTMTPQIAVCLMLGSSLFVVFSSLSLKNFRPSIKSLEV